MARKPTKPPGKTVKPKGKAVSVKTEKKARADFDGGRQRRRLKSWQPSRLTFNSILASSGDLLRARCRDVMRNNPHAVAAGESFAANLIGTGI